MAAPSHAAFKPAAWPIEEVPMKVYELSEIRNVGIIGHGSSGKTSLTSSLLFSSGAVNRDGGSDE